MLGRIVFSHGNSFPGGTYRLMLESLRQRGFEVQVIDKFGHDPQYPVTDNWPHLVQQLADFATAHQQGGEPAFLVGHSLGGASLSRCHSASALPGWPNAPSWWVHSRQGRSAKNAATTGLTARP